MQLGAIERDATLLQPFPASWLTSPVAMFGVPLPGMFSICASVAATTPSLASWRVIACASGWLDAAASASPSVVQRGIAILAASDQLRFADGRRCGLVECQHVEFAGGSSAVALRIRMPFFAASLSRRSGGRRCQPQRTRADDHQHRHRIDDAAFQLPQRQPPDRSVATRSAIPLAQTPPRFCPPAAGSALRPCASRVRRMMAANWLASVGWLACSAAGRSLLMVAANTASPGCLVCGRLSPVSAAVGAALPSTTSPSVGNASPGLTTKTRRRFSRLALGTSINAPSRSICAVFGCSLANASIAASVLRLAWLSVAAEQHQRDHRGAG